MNIFSNTCIIQPQWVYSRLLWHDNIHFHHWYRSCVFGICGGFHSDSMIKGKLKWISENEYINLHFVTYTNNHLKSRPLNCYTSAQHRQMNLLKQRQSGWHHADGTFKHIYFKRPLTPNMLNYFEDYKYIFTFWIISSAWPKKMKLTLKQQYISMT